MSRVYGKKGGRSIRKLDKHSHPDISPVKENSLKVELTDFASKSSVGEDDIVEPLTSPFQSPIKKTRRKQFSPQESKIKDLFDLTEEAHKSDKLTSFIRPTRSLKSKTLQSPIITEEKPTLNSLFIESQNKPTWSPKKGSKSESPDQHFSTQKSPSRKLEFGPQLIKPRVINEQIKQEIDDDDWDFLDFAAPNKSPKKKRLLTKSLLHPGSSPKKSTSPTHEHQVLKYYSSQSHSFNDSSETNEGNSGCESIPKSPLNLINGFPPQLRKRTKTYGNHRSFLIEKNDSRKMSDDGNEVNNESDEFNHFSDDIENINNDKDDNVNNTDKELQTISHLKAQGQNIQLLDEINFILEGIESSEFKVGGLLDLCMKLFDSHFLKAIKDHGLQELHNEIDEDDIVQRMLLGFILCTISEETNNSVVFDDKMIRIVKRLLQDGENVQLVKGSKSTKNSFQEFKQKLKDDYDSVFFGLSLLFQNSIPITFDIYEYLENLLSDGITLSLKSYQMVLILLEKYLNNDENVVKEFKHLKTVVKYDYETDEIVHTLTLKLLIVLTVKKLESIFQPTLVVQALKACAKVEGEDLKSLYFGLLINLVEDASCFKAIVQKRNISLLYSLYESVGSISSGYFGLLVGYIYVKEPISLITHFDRHELEVIHLSLQKFDAMCSKTIQQQVDDILQKFKI